MVIPFDFASKWDNGVLGEKLAEMIWRKLLRDKIVVTTESLDDIRNLCNAKNLTYAGITVGNDSGRRPR